MDTRTIFSISNSEEFDAAAMEIFRYQHRENKIYRQFCDLLDRSPSKVSEPGQIPYLPIEFFKSAEVFSGSGKAEAVFTSSGTTGALTSRHKVLRLAVYEQSFREAFRLFYGDVNDYCVLALLPSYLERSGSSLVYMVADMIAGSRYPESGFYLNELDALEQRILSLEERKIPTLLIGVSFALLDFIEEHPMQLEHTMVMETGGMKGRRKELVREELHRLLKKGFGTERIHSEYGMTELLSQAYSKGEGRFNCPPWMRVAARDPEDPLSWQADGRSGGLNITDLANVDSCSFIATQDLGKIYQDGSFEVLGRFDHSDIRGCNLMVL
ncbi:acyl transferase [Zeaxanthinibacter sp. PT1]|uniref:acyl transferase n=1 Tax=Zeaxanthinibacter TaxID=561554 RepID=UPI00234ABE98|nr:acyl transferase [Zeaxanthinibacter sp. PT1]MDC6351128.1 acyl transferase [Zeaxanthinibacter sp. PT1]